MPLIYDDDTFEPDPAKKINTEAIKELCRCCNIKHYPKRSIISRSGELADRLSYLINGTVIVTALDDNNKQILLNHLNTGDFFGEVGASHQIKRHTTSLRAQTACEVAEIKYEKLEELFQGALKSIESDILKIINLQLAQRLLKATRRITYLANVNISSRIARILMDLCHEPQAMSHPDGTQLHVSRRDIASMAGCSRETAGRALQKMADEGMITLRGKKIVVYHSR